MLDGSPFGVSGHMVSRVLIGKFELHYNMSLQPRLRGGGASRTAAVGLVERNDERQQQTITGQHGGQRQMVGAAGPGQGGEGVDEMKHEAEQKLGGPG